MKIPDEFPDGCEFWASFSGDEFVEFPDGSVFKLEDNGEEMEARTSLPDSGCAPISKSKFLACVFNNRACAARRKAASHPANTVSIADASSKKHDEPFFSPRFALALQFANEIHAAQRRKGIGAPYISHLMAVCSLVLEYGGNEVQAIAALLHDAAEDCGGRSMLETVRGMFGYEVAAIVEACTDSFAESPEEKAPWRPRKEAYLARLATEPAHAKLVSCADKLHNLSNTLRDIQVEGIGAWNERMSETSNGAAEKQTWYYKECLLALATGWKHPMLDAFRRAVGEFCDSVTALDRLSERQHRPFDADESIRNDVADSAIKHVCEKSKRSLMSMKPSGLFGDDWGLRNVWEELCVQIQFEETTCWDDYEFTVRQVVEGVLCRTSDYEKLAIWLESPDGFDWRYGDDEDAQEKPYIDSERLALFIQRTHLYPIAESWSNERIRHYVDRQFQYDSLDTADELVTPTSESKSAGESANSEGLQYHVRVSDRLASDTDVWRPSGDYATAEEAVAAAKKIIDDQLEEDFRRNPDDRPLMLLDGLLDFGFLPYVVGPDNNLSFNAREYAEWKCYELTRIAPPDKLTWDGPNV